MLTESIDSSDQIRGEARLHKVLPPTPDTVRLCSVHDTVDRKPVTRMIDGIWTPNSDFVHNLVLYEWATIVGELLRGEPDGKPYKIGALYIEFENNSGAPVSVPTPARDEGSDYYLGLLSHPTRDYLRVPMTAQTLTSTDEVLFPKGNRVTNFAQTQGTTGVHGKGFSAANQSRVYGAALVATPDFSDDTQDLVLSRFYYDDSDNQMIKITGSEIGVEWRVLLL